MDSDKKHGFYLLKMSKIKQYIFLSLLLLGLGAQASFQISGRILDQVSNVGIPNASIWVDSQHATVSDSEGYYTIDDVSNGNYTLSVQYVSYEFFKQEVIINGSSIIQNAQLKINNSIMENIVLENKSDIKEKLTIVRLNAIEGTTINSGRKNEVILVEQGNFNKATNNSRQIYAQVPGLNIWESDQTGLQLEIGARGLSPQRTAHFNTRQNGYDISADALGYPESYYTPPSEAIEKIQLIRGAASLQYGPQFGGMLNFKLKEGPRNKTYELSLRQTMGSFDLMNTFVSVGGQLKNTNYYSFFQRKSSGGWRPNSSLEANTAYIHLDHHFSEDFKTTLELTHMDYLAQQPGGLTDEQFYSDPSQSNRSANWFRVNWNIFALKADYKIDKNTQWNSHLFGLIAERSALGRLDNISWAEELLPENRDLIKSTFKNWGLESRLIHRYDFFGKKSAVLSGIRYYQGKTHKKQGLGDSTKDPNFGLFEERNNPGVFFDFPSQNISVFTENLIKITDKITLTPGIRFESIRTESEGYVQFENPNNTVEILKLNQSKNLSRNVLLYGLGSSFKMNKETEFYFNVSKNYRAINFNDLYINNTNIQIDPNLKDEQGYNMDLGVRGKFGKWVDYDCSLFYLLYQDRIGFKRDYHPEGHIDEFKSFRLKTNIADSHTGGLESYFSINAHRFFSNKDENVLRLFVNVSYLRGRYKNSNNSSIDKNKIELVPDVTLRTGIQFSYKNLSGSIMHSYTGEQFSDAQNSESTDGSALDGIIPSYHITDLSLKYEFPKNWTVESGINNLLNNSYFTRRAAGYPGPGIIPSPSRNFYISLEKKIN